MIREAPKMNMVSAKLAERRQSVEGGSTLAKPIGNLKPRTLKDLPEHSFKPQISKGSQEIINANNIHYQVTSESVYNSNRDRVERNPRFSGYDFPDPQSYDGRGYGRSEPYYDERMVYGELEGDEGGPAAPPPPPAYDEYEYGGGEDMDDDYSRAYDGEEADYRNPQQGGGRRAATNGRGGGSSFGVLYDPSDSLMPTNATAAAAPKPFNRNNRTQSMYDRTVQWEKERVERMKREKASQEKEEMKKYSFKPNVVRGAAAGGGSSSSGANSNSFYDSGGNGVMSSNGSIADRQNEWARKR